MQDRVISAVTDDLAFRVITVRTTDTVRECVQVQGVHGEAAGQLAELITATVLVRITMAPQLRVQAVLQGAEKTGQAVADSHPDGWSRGLLKLREPAQTIALGNDAVLQVMRSMPNGQLHQGMVEVPRDKGISASLMSYMQNSEQVISTVGVACTLEEGEIQAAGGYLVQLLPEAPEAPLMLMTERLDHDFSDLGSFVAKSNGSADMLMDEILYGIEHQRVEESPLRFACNCSPVRVMASLATLARADIEEFIRDAEPLHLTCDYCGSRYTIEPERLRGLLSSS